MSMDRDDFITKNRLPIRRGQKWSLIEPWHEKQLPRYIEIMEVKSFENGFKCKIKEFNNTRYLSFTISDNEITQFMFAGDILTYYEQI